MVMEVRKEGGRGEAVVGWEDVVVTVAEVITPRWLTVYTVPVSGVRREGGGGLKRWDSMVVEVTIRVEVAEFFFM